MQQYHIYYRWLLKYTIFSSMQPGHSFFYRRFAFKNCFIFKPWLSGCAKPGGTSTDSAFVADSASSWFARGEIWTCQCWPKSGQMIQTCSLNEMVKPKISGIYEFDVWDELIVVWWCFCNNNMSVGCVYLYLNLKLENLEWHTNSAHHDCCYLGIFVCVGSLDSDLTISFCVGGTYTPFPNSAKISQVGPKVEWPLHEKHPWKINGWFTYKSPMKRKDGGNSIFFDFHSIYWGNDPIWRAYFSNGLVQPPHLEKKGTWPEPNLHGFQVPADNLPGPFFLPPMTPNLSWALKKHLGCLGCNYRGWYYYHLL